MEGKEVFRHAVGMVTDVIQGCFADAGVTAADIDWFVPHQANRRIIDASADKLGIAPGQGGRSPSTSTATPPPPRSRSRSRSRSRTAASSRATW